jgi:hypothetical protein
MVIYDYRTLSTAGNQIHILPKHTIEETIHDYESVATRPAASQYRYLPSTDVYLESWQSRNLMERMTLTKGSRGSSQDKYESVLWKHIKQIILNICKRYGLRRARANWAHS